MAAKKKKKSGKKKKFSQKQIAAQKKFAAAAKAGTLRKGSKLKSKSGGSKKGKSGGKKGGRSMAKKKRKKSKQGIVSWLVNVAALVMAAANPIVRAKEAFEKGDFGHFARAMSKDYLGIGFNDDWSYAGFKPEWMVRGSGTLAGAIVFKKVAGYATKSIKIQSLIPGMK